jgi:hypothetical protein
MPVVDKLAPTTVVRGSPITVTGTGFPLEEQNIRIELAGIDIGHPTRVQDPKAFVFLVPESGKLGAKTVPLPLGEGLLRVSFVQPEFASIQGMTPTSFEAGYLTLTSEVRSDITLAKPISNVIYSDTTEFALTGTGFGGPSRDYSLLVDGRDVPVCWDLPATKQPSGNVSSCVGARFASDHTLLLGPDFGLLGIGKKQIGLRRDTKEASVEVHVANSTAGSVRGLSILVSAIVLLLMGVVGLASARQMATGERRSAWRTFLIDTETNTYSLSKLQFYLWTTAVLVAYAYLFLARWLVHDQVGMVELPENLPILFGLSAGTTILSTWIAAVHGPKAAGPVHPSFSDLIATGNSVSPDRFQFLLWTFVAVTTFVVTVLATDPGTIDALPAIPNNLLALSGVSMAGYLGGKMVREPGPVIELITASLQTVGGKPLLRLVIEGRNLDIDGSFRIDTTDLKLVDPNARSTAPIDKGRPRSLKPEVGNRASTHARSLELLIGERSWVKSAGAYQLTIRNQDGQEATKDFSLEDAMHSAFT